MSYRLILPLSTICSVALTGCIDNRESEDDRPNILLLLADDMGYAELGCYGQQIIETPNLDRLASKGVRFTDFHAGNAVSSPSRAVLMTGIPSGHNIIRGNSGVNTGQFDGRVPLRKSDVTMAEMLRDGGYQTAFIGKWHVEDPNDLSTWAHGRGFDFAAQEQWGNSLSTRQYTNGMEYINGLQDSIWYDNSKWDCKDEFRTQIAFDYLDNQLDQDEPFFLFMSYRAPHAHEWYINNKTLYADRGWPEAERMHAAKITLLDQQIGRLLDKLEQMGELDNTLIIFTSDNGPQNEGHDYDFFKSNGDLKGYKRDAFEGGHRVPCIIHWEDKIESGFVSDYICGGQDIMSTVAQAAQVDAPVQAQGLSLLPILRGEAEPKREALYWEFLDSGFSRQAVRMGKWKATRYGVDSDIRLFDLSVDIGETNNIAAQHPDVLESIAPLFESMRSENRYYPRMSENVEKRFLRKRFKKTGVIGSKVLISSSGTTSEKVTVKIDYTISPKRLETSESYLIRSIVFEETGLEVARVVEAKVMNVDDNNFSYRQSIEIDNPTVGGEKPKYYILSQIVKSVDINEGKELDPNKNIVFRVMYKERVVDSELTPFNII